jgi:apolipoprotein N-acyltransferase
MTSRRLWIAAAASGLAYFLASGVGGIGLLAWVAPVPLLAVVFASGGRLRVAPLAIAALAAGFLGGLSWVVLYRGILPAVPLTGFALLLGVSLAVAAVLTARVAARLGPGAAVAAFPALWVSFEFATARWSPHGTAGSLAYTQVDLLPLVQLAAWTGLSGITFVVTLVGASVAAAVGCRPRRWRLALVSAAVLVASFALGAARLATAPAAPTVAVGLASIDAGMRHSDSTRREDVLPVVSGYVESARALAARGAEAVVMPEKMVGVTPAYEADVDALLTSAAAEQELLVVAGLNVMAPGGKRNLAVVYSRSGRVREYDKRHLVPGLEIGYRVGEAPVTYRAPGGMTGVAICKDLDFPSVGRDYSQAGAGLLFVPAWDFTRDARMHGRMAVMRGVEGGFSVARAAADGLLTGSDFFGRIVDERGSGEAARSLLIVRLPIGRGRTFYGEHGDWFAWVCVAAAGLLVAFGFSPKP